MSIRRSIRSFLLLSSATASLPAQTCFHLGSVPVAATLEPSPFALGCNLAPHWPSWHLWTPPHRAPAPHHGFAPGQAEARARLLVGYRCTGWLLLPVLPSHVRTMGYVIDQPELPCGP
jgi:hypothetical protein